MIDDWFFCIELPITIEQFHKLPQNRAYKYEYFGGRAVLSPRPKTYHALLDLASFTLPIHMGSTLRPDETVSIRPLIDADWTELPEVFAASFHRVQPFASLDDEQQLEAAKACLEKTRHGGDGPHIPPAMLVAVRDSDQEPVGGLPTTLMPARDLTDFDSHRWETPPPADAVERRLGRPHLTWIFVSPWYSGHGVGTALLSVGVRELIRLGYSELASTFLLGNESSTLWHWRMGFRLLAYPGSMRLIDERVRLERERADRSTSELPRDPPSPL